MANVENDILAQFLEMLGEKGGAKLVARTKGFGPRKKTTVRVAYEKSSFEKKFEQWRGMAIGAVGMLTFALIAGLASGKIGYEDAERLAAFIGNMSQAQEQTYSYSSTPLPRYVTAPTATPDGCMDDFSIQQIFHDKAPGDDIVLNFKDGQEAEGEYQENNNLPLLQGPSGTFLINEAAICEVQ